MPAVAAVVSFIDAVNQGDVERLATLMHAGHRLQVLDESPLYGRDANVAAWWGYVTTFPNYVIYPHTIAERRPGEVVVVGHTTGSHLDLLDQDEGELTVIWRATVDDGLLRLWQILEDTPARRTHLGVT
jgi:hypothetical protein